MIGVFDFDGRAAVQHAGEHILRQDIAKRGNTSSARHGDIGEIEDNGQFNVVWKTDDLVPGDAWSDHLDGSKDLTADWAKLKCGNYNTKTSKCGGQGS